MNRSSDHPTKKRGKLVRRIERFLSTITASDCAGLTGQGEKVQYTHSHKSMKFKGGKPPADYSAVEMLIDLRIEYNRQNIDDAIPLYYALRRMLNRDDL